MKWVGKDSTRTPSNHHAIPSGILQCLAKFTSRTPKADFERVYNMHLYHSNALCNMVFSYSIFITMGELQKEFDMNMDFDVNRWLETHINKIEMSYFSFHFREYFSCQLVEWKEALFKISLLMDMSMHVISYI